MIENAIDERRGRTSGMLSQHMSKSDEEMIGAAEAMRATTDKSLQDSSHLVTRWHYVQLFLGFGAFIMAVAVGLLVSRSISEPVNRIASVLNEGVDQVSSASEELAAQAETLKEMIQELVDLVEGTRAAHKDNPAHRAQE
jgi:methyl-accepting chemotaxis protein